MRNPFKVLVDKIKDLTAERDDRNLGWDTAEGQILLADLVGRGVPTSRELEPEATQYIGRHRKPIPDDEPEPEATGDDDEPAESGYVPRRDGTQDPADTGYLLRYPEYYRESGRLTNAAWQSKIERQPWGWMKAYERMLAECKQYRPPSLV